MIVVFKKSVLLILLFSWSLIISGGTVKKEKTKEPKGLFSRIMKYPKALAAGTIATMAGLVLIINSFLRGNTPDEALACDKPIPNHELENFFSIFKDDCSPPKNKILSLTNIDDMMRKTTVYYDKEISLEEVKKVARQRVPVAMGSHKSPEYYNVDKFSKLYCDGKNLESYYFEYFNSKKSIAPNIAIYAETPVFKDVPLPNKNPTTVEATKIKVINVVAAAFDNTNQPDYQYFFGAKQALSQEKKTELKLFYKNIFAKIIKCAQDHKCTKIYYSEFGCGAFSSKYPGGKDQFKKEIFTPALNEAKQTNSLEFTQLPNFPNNCSSNFAEEYALFVNAWNPYGIVGNGSKGNGSMDGNFGACTALGALTYIPLLEKLNITPTYVEVQ